MEEPALGPALLKVGLLGQAEEQVRLPAAPRVGLWVQAEEAVLAVLRRIVVLTALAMKLISAKQLSKSVQPALTYKLQHPAW